MKTASSASLPPVPETVAHKTDNLDWERISSESCELNFPAALSVAWNDHLRVSAHFILVSVFVPFAVWLLGPPVAGTLGSWPCGVGAGVLGILLFAYHHRGRLQDKKTKVLPLCSWTALGFLLGPLFLWLAIALTDRLAEPVGAFLYYLLVATPMVFAVADLLATHAVYWLSSELLLDHQTLKNWREDWSRRFLEGPTLTPAMGRMQKEMNTASYETACRLRQNYFLAVFWLLGAILAPCLCLMLFNQNPRAETIGLQNYFALLAGMAIFVWVRLQGHWKILGQTGRLIIHWLHYGNQGPMAPWSFHSPCGSLRFRRWIMFLAVGLLSVALTSMAFDPIVYLISTPHSSTAANTAEQLFNSLPPAEEIPTVQILCSFTFGQWALLAATVICGSLVPPIALFFGIVLVIGPITSIYTKTLTVEGV